MAETPIRPYRGEILWRRVTNEEASLRKLSLLFSLLCQRFFLFRSPIVFLEVESVDPSEGSCNCSKCLLQILFLVRRLGVY